MRAMPAPPISRAAAAQPMTAPASYQAITRGGSTRTITDSGLPGGYNDWQPLARRAFRQIGAVSFAAGVIADCCARCEIRVEERAPGSDEWVPSELPQFAGIMEAYANPLQSSDELIRLHALHYQVAGEMAQTQRDGEHGGVEYGIYSWAAVQVDKPAPGQATIKLVPDGKVETETAFVVPSGQVLRFWIPDPEWQAYAWSPMVASIDDLQRYRSLARYAWKTAESALAMNGLLWAPQGPFDQPVDDDFDENDTGTPERGMEQQYLDAARMRFSESDDIAAIAPTLWHWDKEEGPPQHVKLSEGLDPNGIAYRQEALEDFARGSNLPVTTVIGGGVGDANHWSEWLASEKFFDSGVAPTMNRICHQDLTRSYLWPRAGASGASMDALRNLRIGYDPTPVIVHPDNSRKALDLYLGGLLAAAPTLEAAGFEEEEQMIDPDERQWLLEVLAHGRLATQPAVSTVTPVGADNVVQMPPQRGPGGVTTPGAKVGPSPFGGSVEPELSRVATVLLKALVSTNGDGAH